MKSEVLNSIWNNYCKNRDFSQKQISMIKKIGLTLKELDGQLNESQKSLFVKYIDLVHQQTNVVEKEAFFFGVRYGISFITEVLNTNNLSDDFFEE